MAEKKERFITPVGACKWAHVHHAKAPFKGDTEKGSKYMIDMVFSPDDPAWKDWAGALKKKIEAMPSQINKSTGEAIPKQMPIKRELDDTDKPTGRFYVTFKTGEQFRPGVFDKYGKPIPDTVMIGNESKVRVNYCESAYDSFGGGIALYLNAVQVLDLVEFGKKDAAAYGFDIQQEQKEEPLPF